MIAIDTNILVYAHRGESPFHAAARSRVEGMAEGATPWAIPWPCIYEFWNIVTHPGIYSPPSTPAQAMAQLHEWADAPSCRLIGERSHTIRSITDLVPADIRDGKVYDARIALICRAHGIDELWSLDRDFSRFPWVKTRNPLLG